MTDLQRKVLSISRIFIGFAFWTHGAQKLFGWFGGFGPDGTVELMSRFGIAGTVEFFGGLLLVFGLFTRPVALIAAGEMAVAYWWMHTIVMGDGVIWHWQNRGELVMVYCFVWLLFAAFGGGAWSLDALRAAKKRGAKADAI